VKTARTKAILLTGLLVAGALLGSAQASLGATERALRGGATSVEELVNRFLDALGKKDGKALRALRVDRDEYVELILRGNVPVGAPLRDWPKEMNEYWWGVLHTKSVYSEANILAGFGGHHYRLKHFDFTKGSRQYATYTAYDGKMILPQFIETPDFLHFKFITLNGPAVRNKGMALFPRKVHGRYAMLGRQDGENIHLMFSDNLHFWNGTQLLLQPKFPWEFIQLGNCGSPIETEAGWLVLSHGVGAMRKYCIGAFLLDRDDPAKVIGRLREPLIKPNENEREGYVPNVVYSCGSLVHGRQLIIPYAMSDYAATFATLSLADVLAAME